MDRVILHSDMNNCYASIELLHHPELRGRPLAVGGDPEARHGIVLAKDQLAKKAGVKTGMALWQAREVCPEIQFVPPRMDLYLRFSRLAHEIYGEYTDKQEAFGVDESWLDVTDSCSLKLPSVSAFPGTKYLPNLVPIIRNRTPLLRSAGIITGVLFGPFRRKICSLSVRLQRESCTIMESAPLGIWLKQTQVF